ncbi:hypothetical protein GGR51DRAFT_575912 [Nemania sp. FL0031]|nr:hypothetical protein GGR51DRAFT_575912 [Nemania sp. FL0031]
MEQQHGVGTGMEGASRQPLVPAVALNIVEKRLVRNPDRTGIEQVYFDYACTPTYQGAPNPQTQIARVKLLRENHTAGERSDALLMAFHAFVVEPHQQNMAYARLLVGGVERLQERCSRELAHLASPDFFSARFQNDDHEAGRAEIDDDDEMVDDDETVDDETEIEAGIQADKKADSEVASKKADGQADKEGSRTDEKSIDKAGNKTLNEQGKKKKYQKRKPRVK